MGDPPPKKIIETIKRNLPPFLAPSLPLHVTLYPITGLVQIVDLSEGDDFRGTIPAQLAEDDTIPECLLQLCGGRQLLLRTRLNPPADKPK